MSTLLWLPCLAFFAYISGCINPAYYTVRFFRHKDLRQIGSGTLGTRNVYRNFGLSLAVPVFLFDFFKIWPALALLQILRIDSVPAQALVALLGVIGHIYPAQLHFKGGKGLVTCAGAITFIATFTSFTILPCISLIPVIYAHLRKTKKIIVKYAETDEELQQIFTLNYKTFVEEIPQHEENGSKTLVDKFHTKNTYIICKHGNKIVGMVSICTDRPFSLDAKVENLDQYIPAYKNICEIRLLSVDKAYRCTRVFSRLLSFLVRHVLERNIDIAVISGTTRQLRLYRALGFRPFYKLVGKEGAMYQPMYITPKELRKTRWLPC